MEYASLSEFVNRKTGGNSGTHEAITVNKLWRSAGVLVPVPQIGRMWSTWMLDGYPGMGSVPTGAHAVVSRSTPGAIPFTVPTGDREKWLDYVHAHTMQIGALAIYDRLVHGADLNATLTTTQAVNTPALTRYTSGFGNAIFLEIYTLIGGTSVTATVAYTNAAGVAKTTTLPIGATGRREAANLIPVPLVDNDKGVRSVESVTLSASTGAAGNFGVTIARQMTPFVGQAANCGSSRSFIERHPVKIDPAACLFSVWYAAAAQAHTTFAHQLSLTER